MDQISDTTPIDAPSQDPDDSRPAEGIPAEAVTAEEPGFGSRGRARRRARFLRKARELAYRDLGGLVFSLHRFGQRNDVLVLGKLATLSHIDAELRTIEAALHERRLITVLREAGITACPRCAAIHGSEDRYCPNCGLPMSRNVDLPVAGAPAVTPASIPSPARSSSSPPVSAGAAAEASALPASPAQPAQPESPPLPAPSDSPDGEYGPLGVSSSAGLDPGVRHSAREPGQSTEIIHPTAPSS